MQQTKTDNRGNGNRKEGRQLIRELMIGRNGFPASYRYSVPAASGLSTPTRGVSGLRALQGIISEEYLTKLKSWTTLSKIYIQMRDDVTIYTLLNAIKLPVLSAGVMVEAAPGGGTGDADAAEWLEKVINGMHRQTWYSHMEDQLEMLDFGFSIGEMVLEKRDDGRLWLRNILPRGQETLQKWEFDDEGKVSAFVQRDPIKGQLIPIPIYKCIHSIYKGRKGNPQGWALLRPLWRPWRMVHDLENLEVVGMERDVGGMPMAKISERGIKMESAEITALQDRLEAMRNDEASYAIVPFGVELSPFQGGSKLFDWNRVIERKKKEILMAMFSQFLTLGMANVGTQALVKGSQDFFALALQSIQQYQYEAWNHQLVPYLFMFNSFPGMTGYPEIKPKPVGKVDINALITSYAAAVSTKVLTVVEEDEDYIREVMDLPELPEDERGQPRDVEQPALPGIWEMMAEQRNRADEQIEKERFIRDVVEKTIKEVDQRLTYQR